MAICPKCGNSKPTRRRAGEWYCQSCGPLYDEVAAATDSISDPSPASLMYGPWPNIVMSRPKRAKDAYHAPEKAVQPLPNGSDVA